MCSRLNRGHMRAKLYAILLASIKQNVFYLTESGHALSSPYVSNQQHRET